MNRQQRTSSGQSSRKVAACVWKCSNKLETRRQRTFLVADEKLTASQGVSLQTLFFFLQILILRY